MLGHAEAAGRVEEIGQKAKKQRKPDNKKPRDLDGHWIKESKKHNTESSGTAHANGAVQSDTRYQHSQKRDIIKKEIHVKVGPCHSGQMGHAAQAASQPNSPAHTQS